MYARPVLQEVSNVAQGPIKWVAQAFSLLFHPLICFPLSIVSSAVRGKFYESSVTCALGEQTRYFERGAEVPQPIQGTVSLIVDGVLRHFALGGDITWRMENSVEIEEGGHKKRFCYRRLRAGEAFDDKCREIDLNGARVRIRLEWEISEEDQNYIEVAVGGRREFYRLGNEVAEPIRGTVEGAGWPRRYYLIGNEIAAEAPNCIKIKALGGTLHYETGRELAGPQAGSREFVIDGKRRHFASAKYISSSTLGFSGWFNKIPKLPFKLPTRLSRFSVCVLEFVNKHMSNVIRVAIAISAVILALFGHTYLALGAFVAVAYEYLDHDLGVIPRRVSAFMEKWMPMISMTGLLIVGSFYSQVLAGTTLLLMIPSVNLWTHQKISILMRSMVLSIKDTIINRMMKRGGSNPLQSFWDFDKKLKAYPLLAECDAPLVQNKNLNKAQIDAVLAANNNLYEFNPAHLTKTDPPLLKFPENANFKELIRLWDQIGPRWLQDAAYKRLLRQLADDQRFLELLQTKFPEARRFYHERNWRLDNAANRVVYQEMQRANQAQMEGWIQTLAAESHCTKNEFVARWVRQQIECFVGKLSGTRPIEGEQRYLTEAIQNVAKIIPFLLKPEITPVELEDALAKLAIEGGNYCSLGMYRASREVLEGFTEPLEMQSATQVQQGAPFDMQKFEREVRHVLEKTRLRLIQRMYNGAVVQLFRNKEEMSHTGEDVHLYTALTRAMKRGFYSLDKEDMDQFTLMELMINQTIILPMQVGLMEWYQAMLPLEMNALGIDRRNIQGNRILEYLRAWVLQNQALSAEDRVALLNGILSNNLDNLADADNYQKWGRLMLFVLGIIRPKKEPPLPEPQPVPRIAAPATVRPAVLATA